MTKAPFSIKNTLLLLAVMGLLLGCSARTRYTAVVDVANYLPNTSKTGDLPSGSATLILPGEAGQLISTPQLDVLERIRIGARAQLSNTSNSPLEGNVELRLGRNSDSNINDNLGGDVSLGTTEFNIAAGKTAQIPVDIELSPTSRAEAFNIIRAGQFKLAFKISVSSNGGKYTLQQLRLEATGRPFSIVQ